MIVKRYFSFTNLDYSLLFSVIFFQLLLGFALFSGHCPQAQILSMLQTRALSPSWVAQGWMNVLCLCLDSLCSQKICCFCPAFLPFLFMDASSFQAVLGARCSWCIQYTYTVMHTCTFYSIHMGINTHYHSVFISIAVPILSHCNRLQNCEDEL